MATGCAVSRGSGAVGGSGHCLCLKRGRGTAGGPGWPRFPAVPCRPKEPVELVCSGPIDVPGRRAVIVHGRGDGCVTISLCVVDRWFKVEVSDDGSGLAPRSGRGHRVVVNGGSHPGARRGFPRRTKERSSEHGLPPTPAIVADATATPSPAGLGSPNRLLSSLLGVAAPSSDTGCSRPVPYTGSPRGAGDAAYQPSAGGNNFYAGVETHTGCGRGPVDAAFNVYLLRWSGAS
jgi:hypothetical protein